MKTTTARVLEVAQEVLSLDAKGQQHIYMMLGRKLTKVPPTVPRPPRERKRTDADPAVPS